MKHIKEQRTLMLIKPDGVRRGLIGEILSRVERRGLKIVALKMVTVDKAHLDRHFPTDPAWVTRLGEKTLKTFKEYDLDVVEHMGSDDAVVLGPQVKSWLYDYMIAGPIVALVVEGMHAIDMVRKLAGSTLPVFAEMGTIRGDYSVDSPAIANTEKRGIYNLVHASETTEEATNEIGLWFTPEEIHSYKRGDERIFE